MRYAVSKSFYIHHVRENYNITLIRSQAVIRTAVHKVGTIFRGGKNPSIWYDVCDQSPGRCFPNAMAREFAKSVREFLPL